MVTFIDQHRALYGVEPICRVLPIAPATYFRHKAQQADPTKRSARAMHDEVLKAIIDRIWREHDQAYGLPKIHHRAVEEIGYERIPQVHGDKSEGSDEGCADHGHFQDF